MLPLGWELGFSFRHEDSSDFWKYAGGAFGGQRAIYRATFVAICFPRLESGVFIPLKCRYGELKNDPTFEDFQAMIPSARICTGHSRSSLPEGQFIHVADKLDRQILYSIWDYRLMQRLEERRANSFR